MAEPAALAGPPQLSAREFTQIRELAHRKFGLDLKAGKEGLVSARLGKRLRQKGFSSFQAYYDSVVADRTGEELLALIDALTTNHTSFLREAVHFEYLKERILPELGKRREIEAWSAACATGEEPYTLAFTMLDALGAHRAPEIKILATDISTRALGVADRAIYPAERFAATPRHWLNKYLSAGKGSWERHHRVRPEVRAMVRFERLNLIEGFRHQKRYPVIFCRNVMIYFNNQTKEQLVNRLAECLEPDGHLFVGHAESLTGIRQPLRYVRPAVYRNDSGAGGRTGR